MNPVRKLKTIFPAPTCPRWELCAAMSRSNYQFRFTITTKPKFRFKVGWGDIYLASFNHFFSTCTLEVELLQSVLIFLAYCPWPFSKISNLTTRILLPKNYVLSEKKAVEWITKKQPFLYFWKPCNWKRNVMKRDVRRKSWGGIMVWTYNLLRICVHIDKQ